MLGEMNLSFVVGVLHWEVVTVVLYWAVVIDALYLVPAQVPDSWPTCCSCVSLDHTMSAAASVEYQRTLRWVLQSVPVVVLAWECLQSLSS